MPPCHSARIWSGLRKIVERLVEQDVAEAAAENNPEHAEEEHVVDVARVPAGEQVLPRTHLPQHDEEHKSDQVHQAIPAHGKRPDMKRNRIELRVNEHR